MRVDGAPVAAPFLPAHSVAEWSVECHTARAKPRLAWRVLPRRIRIEVRCVRIARQPLFQRDQTFWRKPECRAECSWRAYLPRQDRARSRRSSNARTAWTWPIGWLSGAVSTSATAYRL